MLQQLELSSQMLKIINLEITIIIELLPELVGYENTPINWVHRYFYRWAGSSLPLSTSLRIIRKFHIGLHRNLFPMGEVNGLLSQTVGRLNMLTCFYFGINGICCNLFVAFSKSFSYHILYIIFKQNNAITEFLKLAENLD